MVTNKEIADKFFKDLDKALEKDDILCVYIDTDFYIELS